MHTVKKVFFLDSWMVPNKYLMNYFCIFVYWLLISGINTQIHLEGSTAKCQDL